ncbi:MAG: phosphoribosylanthranilate isomerase [bacterium]
MKVKICGITHIDDALIAVKYGADALGFLIGLDYPTEDTVAKEFAREVIAELPPFVSSVLVTHKTDLSTITNLCTFIRCTTVQLHGPVKPNDIRRIRAGIGAVKLIKAVHVINIEAIQKALNFAEYVDAILLDTNKGDRIGGTGITHDWSISREIVDAVSVPVILAGGLNSKNVAEAIKIVKPYGVDVNTGVDDGVGNPRKNPKKLKDFIFEAKTQLELAPL